jgi:hypothetical protein
MDDVQVDMCYLVDYWKLDQASPIPFLGFSTKANGHSRPPPSLLGSYRKL